MARKAAKAKKRVKSGKKSRGQAKARNTKAAAKKKVAAKKKKAVKKAAAAKRAPSKKPPPKKASAPEAKAAKKPRARMTSPTADPRLSLKVDDKTLSPASGAELKLTAASPGLGDDEEKFLTVAEKVNDFFVEAKKTAKPGEKLKDTDKLSVFKLGGDEGIDGMLTDILDALARNNPPFTLTLTAELRANARSPDETVGALKEHINQETTRS